LVDRTLKARFVAKRRHFPPNIPSWRRLLRVFVVGLPSTAALVTVSVIAVGAILSCVVGVLWLGFMTIAASVRWTDELDKLLSLLAPQWIAALTVFSVGSVFLFFLIGLSSRRTRDLRQFFLSIVVCVGLFVLAVPGALWREWATPGVLPEPLERIQFTAC
jgi:hypothetical protein